MWGEKSQQMGSEREQPPQKEMGGHLSRSGHPKNLFRSDLKVARQRRKVLSHWEDASLHQSVEI
jgi:hypothetical protein